MNTISVNNEPIVTGKTCSQCGIYKSYDNFSKTQTHKMRDGHKSACKNCLNKKNQNIANNRPTTNISHYMCSDCKEDKPISEFNKDKFKSTGYRTRCRSCDRNYKRTYWLKNSHELIKEKTRHRRNSPDIWMAHGLRVRIGKIMREIYKINTSNKAGSAVRDLGYSIQDFKKYIESKFQSGMTWDNHGFYGWHIDHIKPLSNFDLTNREQFLIACHYTNLQPLWACDNLRKGNKVS